MLINQPIIDIDFYNKNGWVHIKNAVPKEIIDQLRSRGIVLREWVNSRLGQPSQYGSPTYWRGVGCAGMYDEYLLKFYKSNLMFEISSTLLNTQDIWIFNDQMVIKLPNDDFGFESHYDNQYGGENKSGLIHTVNVGVVLDDYTEINGTLEMWNKHENQWIEIFPNSGDIIAINGNTIHRSKPNKSNDSRGLYACVYSEQQINLDNYYKSKFEETFDIMEIFKESII